MAKKAVANIFAPHSGSQKQIMEFLAEDDDTKIMWVANGTKYGKANDISTLVPTTRGYIRLDAIVEGDYVFDEKGQPTLVEFVTDTMYGHECYELDFSDGAKVIADAEHWWVVCRRTLNEEYTRKTTEEILTGMLLGQEYSVQSVVSSEGRYIPSREIRQISRVKSVPVKCIRVENPTHLFLITQSDIPTHNTLAACGGIANAVPKKKKSLWRIVAPIYRQTKISWKYISDIWPGEPYVTKNKSDMTMYLPGTGCELQFWHGQNPEDLEGEGVHGQVNDECAKLKQQIMDSTRTTMTRTQGRILNISTPRGRNWFYKGCMRAKEEMERAAREKRVPREIFLTAPTSDNRYVSAKSIAEAKRLLPDRLFRQYYLAEFVEDGAVFLTPAIDPVWKEEYYEDGPVHEWIHPDAKKKTVVVGVDWAKKLDFTVVTVWDFSMFPLRMVGFLRFQGKRYTDQVVELAKFLRGFGSVEILYHDKTGVGEALDDMLDAIPGLVYKGVTFTMQSKSYMVNDVMMAMERKEVLFPWWPELFKEFDTFEVETTDMGNMRYAAAEGSHDDIVFSCCLGLSAAIANLVSDFEIKILEELKSPVLVEGTWENYMNEIANIDIDEGF